MLSITADLSSAKQALPSLLTVCSCHMHVPCVCNMYLWKLESFAFQAGLYLSYFYLGAVLSQRQISNEKSMCHSHKTW